MKYMVKPGCMACGRCAWACPEVFSLNEDGRATAISDDIPEEAEAYAYAAMDGCPACAIVQQD